VASAAAWRRHLGLLPDGFQPQRPIDARRIGQTGPCRAKPRRDRRLVPAEVFHECQGSANVRPCSQEQPSGRTRSRGVAIVDGATVSVAVVASRTEAELIAGMLRSRGVSAAVSADDAGGQYPQMQADGVRVLVAPSDEASARRLLAVADDDTSSR
jgi:hypothetical protein